ncbi:hypothetical protein B296_00049021 [Ensete ventricosum]|uniref:C2 domain-containing protein n=1 Tax=Ensete ventricosum TaxID=4639 RepID=A0A426YJ01_ENSVE|nr:hypothetical protein B296_00049021 [Ensete ventricosum]
MCHGWVDAVRGRSVSPIAPPSVFGKMDPRRRKAERVEHLLGLLKVRVLRGVNLAYRDARGSDPYVVLRMGSQVVVFLL